MALLKKQLPKELIEDVRQKVMLGKLVNELLRKTKVPHSAYYSGMSGGKINEKFIKKIENYVNSL